MHSLLLVAKAEYVRMVARRSFLIGALGVPALLVFMIAAGILISSGSRDTRPLGYVDLAAVTHAGEPAEFYMDDRSVPLTAFADEAAADAALAAGKIQAYYLLPADYRATRQVSLRYWQEQPGERIQSQFNRFLRASLAFGLPESQQAAALRGVTVEMRTGAGDATTENSEFASFILPFLTAFLFVILVMSSAGYLLQALTTEKENRMVEVLFTSLTPLQLVAGKALGLLSVSLTQFALWLLLGGSGLTIAAQQVDFMAGLRVPWPALGMAALYFLPTFALVAGLMIAIGSIVAEVEHGQQVASLINLLVLAPLFFMPILLEQPGSPLSVALTLFPATSFFSVILRWSIDTVPIWQIAVSWVLLIVAAGLSVWAAARIFRAGMLRYGQPLSLRAAWAQGRSA